MDRQNITTSHHSTRRVSLKRALFVLACYMLAYGAAFVGLKKVGDAKEASLTPQMSLNLQAYLMMRSTTRGKMFSEVIPICKSVYGHSDDRDLQKMARLGERLYTSLLTLFGDHPIDGDGPSSITEAFEGAYNMLEHPIESVKFFAQTAEMLIKKSDYQVIDQRLEERYKLELAEFNSKLSLAQQAKTFPLKLGMPLMLIIHVILFRRINKTLLQALQMGRR